MTRDTPEGLKAAHVPVKAIIFSKNVILGCFEQQSFNNQHINKAQLNPNTTNRQICH